jgi:putative endonuclease
MIRRGEYGEILARQYLEGQGIRVLETNFRFHHGEIDIVAEEGDVLIFCEVKIRFSGTFGPPELAVTAQKQRQIRKIAGAYLLLHRIRDRVCRFDIVAIRVEGDEVRINHIRDAFR